ELAAPVVTLASEPSPKLVFPLAAETIRSAEAATTAMATRQARMPFDPLLISLLRSSAQSRPTRRAAQFSVTSQSSGYRVASAYCCSRRTDKSPPARGLRRWRRLDRWLWVVCGQIAVVAAGERPFDSGKACIEIRSHRCERPLMHRPGLGDLRASG